MESRILLVELSGDGRPFDGLTTSARRGSPFVDMFGREIEISLDDLREMESNTRAVIESTATESGEIVGLPIDVRDHDKGDGAGWIVGVELADDVLRFIPKWTEIGRELIEKGIRRLFSATVDMTRKVVIGGTLTNWPAVRSADGRLLLRPIELCNLNPVAPKQEGKRMGEQVNFADLPKADQARLRYEAGQTVRAEFGLTPKGDPGGSDFAAELVAEMRQKARDDARAEMQAEMAAQKRAGEISEFCNRITGGTDETPHGLSIEADRLEKILTAVPDAERAELQTVLGEIVESGVVNFQEEGHAQHMGGKSDLPEWAELSIRKFVAKGNKVEDWFQINPDLIGSADDYDLSAFVKEE